MTGKIGEEPPDIPTIKNAVEKYLADAEARHLAAETVRKRRELLEGKLLPFCNAGGYSILKHLDVDVLRKFRASWPYAPLSARKRLEYLRSFFRFCHDRGWVERNPALAVKSSKVDQTPTLPFSDDEVERVLVAARALASFGRYGPKIEAMVLLLRYSGLRIQDAACLERARLVDDKLFLYQQKTGTPVYCPLPPQVVERLTAVRNENELFSFTTARVSARVWSRVGTASFRKCLRPPRRRSRAGTLTGSATPSPCRSCSKAYRSKSSQDSSGTAPSRSQSATTRRG